MPYVLDRSLYLNADKNKVLEEGDPAARYVLGVAGSTVSDEDAKLYGLDKVKGAAKMRGEKEKEADKGQAAEVVEEEAAEEDEEKAKADPAANKAQQPKANKAKK
jgi:hypothetical protein